MAAQVTLDQLHDAKRTRDPQFVDLLLRLVSEETAPEPPPREGAYTFNDFLVEQHSPAFRRKPLDEKAQIRIARLAALEAEDAEVPLSDQLRSYEVLIELWNDNDLYSRTCLLKVIAEVPIVYGPFKALKRIFKEAEANNDTEIYGALAARFDMVFADRSHSVSHRTIGYLVRRAWRYLRRVGETFPATYPDVATDFLIHYQGWGDFIGSWILNHIFFHEMQAHSRTKFHLGHYEYGRIQKRPSSTLKYRAFGDLWRRSPRPLFTLLENGKTDVVLGYAVSSLKSDFRSALREVEPSWVARLVNVHRESTDEFVIWILDNVPRFEQSKFRELELHDAVLNLFDSESSAAKKYAAKYARTHARDLPVDRLILLANSYEDDVRKLAVDLLLSRDPRKEVGLEAWGELLQTEMGFEIAREALRKHFGASELTPEWFSGQLRSRNHHSREFAEENLLKLHSREQLGLNYFIDLIEQLDADDWSSTSACNFGCEQIEKLGFDQMPHESLRRLLLHPLSSRHVVGWVGEGKLKPTTLGVDFLKVISFRPSFETDPLLAEMRKADWWKARANEFDENLATQSLGWLKDDRQFLPEDLQFTWLLELVKRSEPLYHNFAVETLTRSFLPADFAATEESGEAKQADEEPSGEINIDLGGASFVFTGKLQTMTRAEAKGKVTAAGGANSGTVGKKLDYLVIGDEGSPLYGQGRKGSKQTKAEQLNEDGAGVRIISERAFLQMLAGEQREFSEDAIMEGCERLWSMMCDADSPDEPLARFARSYIRHHHPGICLAETDRPVDPGAEIPDEFLTFDRVLPLFSDQRKPLRDFALELAKWEFARWSPPIDGIVTICDSPYPEVREFVATAMTADESPEHRRYRVDSSVLTADAVYSFCESRNRQTRALGMKLIDLHPRLKVPSELFRLTESPDGSVRGFVIRTFWSLYRDRGVTDDWKPTAPPESKIKKKKSKEPIEEQIGFGVPAHPENLPAEFEDLRSLLRRILFEIPPGPPPKSVGSATDRMSKLKPMPARQSKLKLVETLRDLAIDDVSFAEYVLPLLREFKQSRGKSEQAACLVAVTRIEHRHETLREAVAAV